MVSKGCESCYAMKQAHRFSGQGKPYEGLTELGPQGPRWTGKITLVPDALDAPLHWKTPRRVFVNSMSDLFHEDVPNDFIAAVFGIMCVASQHTYQILTKRPARMRQWCGWIEERGGLAHYVADRCDALYPGALVSASSCAGSVWRMLPERARWPLPNVWLGVSIEDQATLWRLDELRRVPAAIRFVSFEPLLEDLGIVNLNGIQWAILGGESGPNARPCNLAWIRAIMGQCQAAELPVFVKQFGARPFYTPGTAGDLICRAITHKKGADMAEYPEEFRVREWPR